MKTGIVVSAYDPTYKNRIKVRVYGVHTEQVEGNYLILDDDLPWASPAPNVSSSSGSYSVPKVGSRVYVDGGGYKWTYYGPVEVKGSVKRLMDEHPERSEELNVIAFSESEDDKRNDYVKVYYLPDDGLNIECDGHKILLTKYDGLKISTKGGTNIELTRDDDINIETKQTINLKCKKLNLTEGSLSEETVDRIVSGNRLQEIFNNHVHICAGPGGITTNPPVEKIKDTDMCPNIKISK